jgi:hypothetical protein
VNQTCCSRPEENLLMTAAVVLVLLPNWAISVVVDVLVILAGYLLRPNVLI